MKVLLTGAFGNVGESTLEALCNHGHDVRCFDLPNKKNRKINEKLGNEFDFDIFWGDIRNYSDVSEALEGVEAIIHLAAIIPPQTDRNLQLAREVNVGGTENLVNAALESGKHPRFVYASSIATYGHCTGDGPPKKANDPQIATDAYTAHKIECESIVKESALPWTIMRFGVVTPLRMSMNIDPIMFEIPLEQRIEFVHTKDIGLALARGVTADVEGKILLLGGGQECRMDYREFVTAILDALGVGMLPDEAFLTPESEDDYFHTDWMNSQEAQELLDYQTRSFEQFLDDFKNEMGKRRILVRLFRPLVRRYLLHKSPYY
ncbi:MAG: NAD(P)-dependent oxidoreductase [Candidatus Thorarchaeota archaeon]|nr:NAD(P)-dependent oxidoreductase [Candidatus Thorarchaeota archaeon]